MAVTRHATRTSPRTTTGQLVASILALALMTGAGFAAAADSMKLTFGGQEFVHRWSKEAQHEFTPPAEADLKSWRTMVTVNVHDKVRNGDQLAQLANSVLGNYQRAGKIVRTDSKPRTASTEAEHLIVAILAAKGVMEAAFARVKLVDGTGVVAVYSRREYGDKAAAVIGEWLQKNGETVEKTLMTWDRIPTPATLKALPASK